MDALLLPASIIVFILGASIGSFLNVVIYRVPAGLSVLYPPSRCPQCLHKLGKRENVPVFGWLLLRGRCRHCQTKISPRYPIVEAVTGLIFLFVFWMFGFSVQTLGYWAFCSWLLALSLIDFDTMTLPESLTRSGLVLGLIFQLGVGYLAVGGIGTTINQLMFAISGAVVGIWLLSLITIFGSLILGQTAMGWGDSKLAAMMGAWLGWKYLLLAGFLACALGAFVGGGAIAIGLLDRRQPMPFGPFLAMGAAIALFWGEWILSSYLQLFFP
ncbi:prepilin peptidase [Aliterella atlantica]|uniref:Prepilin leader peptidase/N-methyltransferase n=1 Tax=Aliterella atlantica CENA595 TaxID=1618023 RepID=A0A0D8ZQN5_9CYAN|nr:A24 family peptidase [Aliterella atlantica]KJH70662.1 methyltransferase [Aliterella atlantica CENA595]